MQRLLLIPLLAAQPFLAAHADADTPAYGSFSEQTVMVSHEDPMIRMQAGLAACLGTPEGPDTAEKIVMRFVINDWHAGAWGGLTELDHLTSLAYVADDNSFCEIGDYEVNTDAAADVVRTTFAAAGVTGWTEGRASSGCTMFEGPHGRVIEVNSGGGDPVCQSPETSAIRVWNPEGTQ